MGYLFDTDAISWIWKPRVPEAYLAWLEGLRRADQFTSAVVLGELYKGAYRSQARERYLGIIEGRVLPEFTVIDYDRDVAREYGRIRADLERRGTMPGEADLMIAASALVHGHAIVTGNVRHYMRVDGLEVQPIPGLG